MVIIDYLRARLFDSRKRRAVRQAQRDADLYGKKFLVLVWQGRPVVLSMQAVKKLIRQKRLNLSPEKARQIAVYEALPKRPRP